MSANISLIADVRDISGEDLTDALGSDEVRPGDICVVGGIGYGKDKDKDMKGAQASLPSPLSGHLHQALGSSKE